MTQESNDSLLLAPRFGRRFLVRVMNWLLVAAIAGIAGYVALARPSHARSLQPGQIRLRYPESSPATLSQLRTLFTNVIDHGNGVYTVTVSQPMTVQFPSGVQVL